MDYYSILFAKKKFSEEGYEKGLSKFKALVDGSITEVTAEDLEGVTEIRESAFLDSVNIISVVIPNSVTSIHYRSFSYCKKLKTVIIPNSVTIIDAHAFKNCPSLENITIPNSVTLIGTQAFENCTGFTSVIIPKSIIELRSSCFYGCINLTSVTIKAITPPTLQHNNVFNNTNNCPIYVPAESVEAYKTATNWTTYASRIFPIPEE